MRGNAREKVAPPVLDDLLGDSRLARLFSKEPRDCALQLWILQIKIGEAIENRVVYGRLLPYSHATDKWSASDDDEFEPFGDRQAQVIRLNLYCRSPHCADLLHRLSAGKTIAEISDELKLGMSEHIRKRFGATSIASEDLAYRPVAYLLNRDAYDRRTPTSPHGGAGAFSASITQASKGRLFLLGLGYDVGLTTFVVKHLNADTGLDFGGADIVRFGDIELLVFPALDDQEGRLLWVEWSSAPCALIARFNPMQMPHFSGFQFRLSIANDAQIVYSGIATATRDGIGIYECRFEFNDQLRERTDSTELEIFGLHSENSHEATLCCRWRISYVREINLQGNLAGGETSPVRFDWLEEGIRRALADRAKAALTLNRGSLGFTNQIGGRAADPWVPANRELVSLFAKLHPSESEGHFFLRRSQGDGDGRLKFVEWFRKLLRNYHQHQVVIFDPYFEDVGLGLLLLCVDDKADVIVFTSLPKSKCKEEKVEEGESDPPQPSRVNNLVVSCEQNRHLMRGIKLRIYGLKYGRLHDRYILIMGPDKLPVAGFNLSNSIQKATENYPLLITPIPADVLLQVEQYKSGLVVEAKESLAEGPAENAAMRTLFESTVTPRIPVLYEPLRILEHALAGDVLAAWTGDSSLQGLSGEALTEQMKGLELINDDSLALPEPDGLRNCLVRQAGDFTNFTATWDVLGELLAHTRTMDTAPRFAAAAAEPEFLEFLAAFIQTSFKRPYGASEKMVAVAPPRFFHSPVELLLHSSYHPHHLFHATKYSSLTWPEYFAIKILWWSAPEALLKITETEAAALPGDDQESAVMPLSLLSQIVSDISLSVQFEISTQQRDRLVRSNLGLLQWMGLNAIERELDKPDGLDNVVRLIRAFSYPEQVRALGWMVHRAARISEKAERFKGLVAALHAALPETIAADDLKRLVDSMRGHMHHLSWAEPGLFVDVIYPLLQSNRIKYDDASAIWMQELAGMLEPANNDCPELFDESREGQTTNFAAFLVANSTLERRRASLAVARNILKRKQRIVQQPLASTSDWNRWNNALTVSFWLLGFNRWIAYYLHQRGITDLELERLSRDSRDLALIRPMVEWREEGAPKVGQLAAFLDQAEELLAALSGSTEGCEISKGA